MELSKFKERLSFTTFNSNEWGTVTFLNGKVQRDGEKETASYQLSETVPVTENSFRMVISGSLREREYVNMIFILDDDGKEITIFVNDDENARIGLLQKDKYIGLKDSAFYNYPTLRPGDKVLMKHSSGNFKPSVIIGKAVKEIGNNLITLPDTYVVFSANDHPNKYQEFHISELEKVF